MECNLHVGNLPWSTTTKDLTDLCQEYGEIQHAEVIIGRDGRSRGYGAVVYVNAEDANRCINGLNNSTIEGREITVRLSKPRGERFTRREQGTGDNNSKGYKVFVGNLPWSITWQDLKDLAKGYGDVAFAAVQTNFEGRSRGMGTVTFHELQDAYECIERMNGLEVEGRQLLVKEDNRNPLPSPPI